MKENYLRGGCKDVFHAFLVKNAKLCGEYGFPAIKGSCEIPRKMIAFSKALKEKEDFHQWVCFYEDDHLFERLWNAPSRYLNTLKKYDGVILPDFSVYYDFPLALQIWNIYRSRAIGSWLVEKGIKVIPNVRFGDDRTYDCCCDGIAKYSVISIGTHGCLKDKHYRTIFENGIEHVVKKIKPSVLLLYGGKPSNINSIKKAGVSVVQIKPDYSFFKKEEV